MKPINGDIEDIVCFIANARHHLEEAQDNLEGLFIPSNEITLEPMQEIIIQENITQIKIIREELALIKKRILVEASK